MIPKGKRLRKHYSWILPTGGHVVLLHREGHRRGTGNPKPTSEQTMMLDRNVWVKMNRVESKLYSSKNFPNKFLGLM